MSDTEFMKRLKEDEKSASATLGKLITAALNDKATQKEAAKITGSSQPWPVPPEKKILALYDRVMKKAWGKQKSAYGMFTVGIEVVAPKGKTPFASVTAKYDGENRGGSSHWLKKGETVFRIAEQVYGHDVYANAIWKENPKLLGVDKAFPVPAGYEIRCPRIWVPNWINPPKVAPVAGVKVPAAEMPLPSFTIDVDKSVSKTVTQPCGPFIVIARLEGKIAGEATRPGTMDASVNLKSLEAEMTRDLGGLSSKFTLDIEQKKGNIGFTVVNTEVNGMSFNVDLEPQQGKIKAALGSQAVKGKMGKTEYTAKVSLTLEIQFKPNPAFKPEKVRAPDPEPDAKWDFGKARRMMKSDPTLVPKVSLVLMMATTILLMPVARRR
ncbi:hypothetical protein LNKW23_11140 [Paralimibaculum aggregatum]|uniref:LysM domain-containing protein n=1 Tax=Paralimibaculum aggregatum TaxID=3036245 RepID=A0ABQ6LEZ7_9RHOB|nr:hypothetical protein [Limibaculum sp. NKW23]GMG81901.1 hypothetical protein LNKW23_11140 [Limibaculum sp. NKW23]